MLVFDEVKASKSIIEMGVSSYIWNFFIHINITDYCKEGSRFEGYFKPTSVKW